MGTLEHRLKFESGLPIGVSLVEFSKGDQTRRALVEIGKRGAVYVLAQPRTGDMYSGWYRVQGDKTETHGATMVWAARNSDIMAQFEGSPVARIAL